ncbi:MAG: tetratricopeptide repeat protein [Candidatus Omnitrophica bacterium]|nr:tetratricopeptide repeat protein [Candidatus Omnitrophota bacterium]
MQSIWHYFHGRFFVFLSLAFNYHFNGLNVFGYHLFNLAVHIITAILVWWLTLLTLSTPAMKEDKITRHASLIALFAGLVFVSHPVQTEAVTYIWQRAASMAAMFYLASLCLYVKSRLLQVEKLSLGHWKFYYTGSLITAVVAMFTKENAVTLPLMILFYEYSFLNTKKSFNWRILAPFLLTIFIVPVTFLFIKSQVFQSMHGDLRAHGGVITPMHYFLTQFRTMVTYIRLLFIPLNQNLDYDYPIFKNILELPVLISFLFLTVIFYWAKRLFLRYRLFSFSIFWFFLTLTIPESSFWAMGGIIFEHRLYLPLAGFSIFLVSGAYYLWGKNRIKMMVMVLAMIIGWNSLLTYQRNNIWKDNITLWNDAVLKSPYKPGPYFSRGAGYFNQGNFDRAMVDFNKAIAIDPDNHIEPYINRGLIYESRGEFIKAIADYTKAIKISFSRGVLPYHTRSILYHKLGNFSQALSDAAKAIEIDPYDFIAYNIRGCIYGEMKNFTQAVSDLTKSIEINPYYPDAYYNRAGTYYLLKEYDKAWSDAHKAKELGYAVNPGFISELKKSSGR